ncbi:hypothetical protein E4K10_00640 [Streptomyces sp. T1317-0309]|nr:hypothetical protein E4K10_00640 [Streptomyces sp. T1317-0309]
MSGAPEHFAAVEADWRPGPVEAAEFVTAAPVRALAGLFDQPVPALGVGDPLPPLWHWLYVLDRPAQADLGEDGHPRDGGLFLPPLPDRRRMFGGGRLEFRAPIRVGDLLTRRSEVASVRARHGGSGWLLLVTVRHDYLVDGEIRTVEEQDLVYKQAGIAPVPEPAGEAVPAAPAEVPTALGRSPCGRTRHCSSASARSPTTPTASTTTATMRGTWRATRTWSCTAPAGPVPAGTSRAAAPRNAPSPPSRSAREPLSSRRGTSR